MRYVLEWFLFFLCLNDSITQVHFFLQSILEIFLLLFLSSFPPPPPSTSLMDICHSDIHVWHIQENSTTSLCHHCLCYVSTCLKLGVSSDFVGLLLRSSSAWLLTILHPIHFSNCHFILDLVGILRIQTKLLANVWVQWDCPKKWCSPVFF